MLRLKTIDAHAAGEPLRLVVDGVPAPRGRTMLQKRESLRRTADHLRRVLMLEPRGHADMYGAILTEPVSPDAHAGILFMHNEGYSTMCGHGIIAATTIALERGLVMPGGDGATIVYDTPAGTVRARACVLAAAGDREGGAPQADDEPPAVRVQSVAFANVPSFVLHGGLVVKAGGRHLRVDVAYGGAFYAIVDSEAVGLSLDGAHLAELRAAGTEISRAVEAAAPPVHPSSGVHGIYGTIFTAPPHGASADLRNVAVFAGAEVDRSPCGTGTAAVMAVLDAMGLLADEGRFVHESIIGTRFTGRIAGRTMVGDYPAIVPEIEGSAWITGEHTFFVGDDDPLGEGFRL